MNEEFSLHQLSKEVSELTGVSEKDVQDTLTQAFKTIAFHLAKRGDNRVELHGLGVLKLKKKKERSGIAPNGVEYTTPEHYRIKFRASDTLIRTANEWGEEVLTLPIAR